LAGPLADRPASHHFRQRWVACCQHHGEASDGHQHALCTPPYQRQPTQEPPPAELLSVLSTHGNLPCRFWTVRHRKRWLVDASFIARTGAAPNFVFDDSSPSSIGRAVLSRRGTVEHPLQRDSTTARRQAPASAMMKPPVVV